MARNQDIKENLELGLPVRHIELPTDVLQLFKNVSAMSTYFPHMIGSTVMKLLLGEPLTSDLDFVGQYDFDAISQAFADQIISYDTAAEVLKMRIGKYTVDLIQAESVMNALWWRDITTSLLVLDTNGSIYDPLNALDDIQKRRIRMVDPIRKIKDDPSRLLRVLRFAIQLGFCIEESTSKAISADGSTPTYDQRIQSELARILTMGSKDRFDILKLGQRIGIEEQFANILIEHGRYLISSNQELREQLKLLELHLGIESGYVFGGAIRDILRGREFRDIDIKLKMEMSEFIKRLESAGFVVTDDVELPERTYYYNRRFNAVSIRIEEMIFDFTQFRDTSENEWYRQADINFNSATCDFACEIVNNERVVPEIILGHLRLISPELTTSWDPLHAVNYLKQVSRDNDLYLDETDIRFVRSVLPLVYNFFQANRRMLYKLEGLLGNVNSDFVLGIIRETEEGQKLLEILQIYLSGES